MTSAPDNKRDNYHIVSLIGQGAYGQVFKARRKGTGQFVAIKTIKKKYSSDDLGTNRKRTLLACVSRSKS